MPLSKADWSAIDRCLRETAQAGDGRGEAYEQGTVELMALLVRLIEKRLPGVGPAARAAAQARLEELQDPEPPVPDAAFLRRPLRQFLAAVDRGPSMGEILADIQALVGPADTGPDAPPD